MTIDAYNFNTNLASAPSLVCHETLNFTFKKSVLAPNLQNSVGPRSY